MKGMGILAFLGGVAAGVCVGMMIAPDKGKNTRHHIIELLEVRGIILGKQRLEQIVAKIKSKLHCGYTEADLKAALEQIIAEEHL